MTIQFRIWDARTGALKDTLYGHSYLVSTLAFSPNSAFLASGSDDATIRIWDVATGRETNLLEGHTSAITSVAFTADGQTLASASYDETLRLWDVASSTQIGELGPLQATSNNIALSPDGTTLASGSSDHSVSFWQWRIIPDEMCPLTGRNLSAEEWQLAFGDRPYVCTCAQYPPGDGVQEGTYANCE